jgi:hypothetical protein
MNLAGRQVTEGLAGIFIIESAAEQVSGMPPKVFTKSRWLIQDKRNEQRRNPSGTPCGCRDMMDGLWRPH